MTPPKHRVDTHVRSDAWTKHNASNGPRQFVKLAGGVMTPPYGWCSAERFFIRTFQAQRNGYKEFWNYRFVTRRMVVLPRCKVTMPVRQISRISKSRIRLMKLSILRLSPTIWIMMDSLV